MSEVEVSVIIPAYNAEMFIERAVNSILKQDIESDKLEILVIENGSTDNTNRVVEKMIEKSKVVKLFHSSKGVSNARNMGITQAQGKWILFLDADDILLEGVLEHILNDANKSQSDMYFYGHRNNNEDREVCDNKKEEQFDISSMETCKIKVLRNPTRYMQAFAKLYKVHFLRKNGLKFNTSLRLSEDSDFCFQCLQFAESVEFKNTIIYKMFPNHSSTMRSFDGNKINDYIFALNQTEKLVYAESKEIQHAFSIYILMHLNIAMVRENFSFNNPNNFLKKYKNMSEIIKQPIFEKAINEVKINECFSFRMLPILFIKLKWKLGASIVYIIRVLQNYLRENKKGRPT